MMGTFHHTANHSDDNPTTSTPQVEPVPTISRETSKNGRINKLRQTGPSDEERGRADLASKLSSPFLLRFGRQDDTNKENTASGSGAGKESVGGDRRSARLALPPLVEKVNVTAAAVIEHGSLSTLRKQTFGYGKGLGLQPKNRRAGATKE
jgi:hypothetical protein